jgi:hypothetical protein
MAYTSTLRLDIPLNRMAKLSSMCLKLALVPSGQIFAYRNMPGHVAQHVAPERNIRRRCSQRSMFHPTECAQRDLEPAGVMGVMAMPAVTQSPGPGIHSHQGASSFEQACNGHYVLVMLLFRELLEHLVC